jgi:nitroreductase
MDIRETIKSRRSIGKVKQDPIDEELIKQLLAAAIWAPNHYHTEPWRFFVLTAEGRKPLGRILAEIAKENMENPEDEKNHLILKKQEEKPFRAPVIIAVAVVPSNDPKVEQVEENAAVNAAIQNILLSAHSLGLGAIWRTGKPCYHPKMKTLFGLSEKSNMLGFIYLGYPDIPTKKGLRTSYEEKTVWINSDIKYS